RGIEISRNPIDEAAGIVAPVGETRQPERQSTAELGSHRGVRILGIASPVQRITLAPGPGASGPDDPIACCLFRDFRYGFVITQRIEVMLIKARAPGSVHPIRRSALAEIYFDCSYSHLQKAGEQALIPLHRRGVAEVESRIFIRQFCSAFVNGIA